MLSSAANKIAAKGTKRGRAAIEEEGEQGEKLAISNSDASAPKDAPVKSKGPSFAKCNKIEEFRSLLEGDTGNLSSITFGADFGIRDEHLIRLANATGPRLTELRLGSSDTGDGVHITDRAVCHVADKCPNLRTLQLSSCTGVSDAAFLHVLRQLRQLSSFTLTGHDRSHGKLTNKALNTMIKESLAPQLRQLYITDQGPGYDAVQKLIKKRKGLKVQAGETDSDSFAWGSVMGAMGRSYGDGMYGNW